MEGQPGLEILFLRSLCPPRRPWPRPAVTVALGLGCAQAFGSAAPWRSLASVSSSRSAMSGRPVQGQARRTRVRGKRDQQ